MTQRILRINLWSGPRNVSTALMYAFAQRSDTRVFDEPLYGHYLRVSGAHHPGRELVLARTDVRGERVIANVVLGPHERPVVFFKQMAHHLVRLELAFLARCANVLLIRDPREMLPSLAQNLERPSLRDTGLARQSWLYDWLRARGQVPAVLDARQVLLDPRGVLGELCRRLGLAFEERMLTWPAGGRPEDGVWAPHWYASVHRSTGFQAYEPKTEPLAAHLEPLLAECRPHYERLAALAIRAQSASV